MIRIDVDRYVLLFIECGDELHRYAVESHATCRIVANMIYDHSMRNNGGREPKQQFTLAFTMNGHVLDPESEIAQFKDGVGVTVTPLKQEGQ